MFSKTSTVITDKYKNQINTKKFEHKINEKDIKIFDALMKDRENNTFEIESRLYRYEVKYVNWKKYNS